MEPKIGTTAYLIYIMNPFRRPMCLRYISPNVLKAFSVGGVLLFALISWSFRGNGLLGVGLATLICAMWLAVIAIHIEAMLRLFAIWKNFEARIADWKSSNKRK